MTDTLGDSRQYSVGREDRNLKDAGAVVTEIFCHLIDGRPREVEVHEVKRKAGPASRVRLEIDDV
jgi:hypothetical protein